MAQTDLTGFLTGISSAPIDPMLNASFNQRAMARQQASSDRMRQGIGALTGANTQTTKEKVEGRLAQLDINEPNDQEEILKLVSVVNPQGAAQLKAQFAQQGRTSASATDSREAVAAQIRAAGYGKLADAVIAEQASGSEIALAGAIKLLTNLSVPASKTILTKEEELELYQGKEKYKSELGQVSEATEKASMQSEQYLPVLKQMQEITDSVDFGTGSTLLSAGNAALHSFATKIGLDVESLDPNVDATKTYNSLSKRLKAWLLEAQKGAISNLENAEITKNTANPDMTKNQAGALVNFSEAAIMSQSSKAEMQANWLDDNRSLRGFEAAWGQYIEDFPRTEGFLVTKDLEGQSEVMANFKPIRGNMGLFQALYGGKGSKGKSPVFVDKSGKGFKIKDVKKDVIQGKIDEMKKDTGDKNWKPSKEQLALYELEARRKVGELISFRLQNGTYTVAK
jgi:hypothetical protein